MQVQFDHDAEIFSESFGVSRTMLHSIDIEMESWTYNEEGPSKFVERIVNHPHWSDAQKIAALLMAGNGYLRLI